MSIEENLKKIHTQIPDNVRLVCVSKFHPNEAILEAYRAGERIFGESRVQELCEKQISLPKDIQWHFIGHLQTNKVKYIVPFVDMIHAVDSLKLLEEIDRQAGKVDRIVRCLFEVHIAREASKFGFLPAQLEEMLKGEEWKNFRHVQICGLMGMATYTDNQAQIRQEFRTLKSLFDRLKVSFFSQNDNFRELSMGMSNDFQIAIEEGSTLIRLGTIIFGERDYPATT
ncbi:MAG: YggS family pyridoxal phosphate-dependent enzyme [Paludibacteraceae bacterium]|nr:YggS family pyridoxal phosphate-dependent enzyme [Paludibacteraceae bacterium]